MLNSQEFSYLHHLLLDLAKRIDLLEIKLGELIARLESEEENVKFETGRAVEGRR